MDTQQYFKGSRHPESALLFLAGCVFFSFFSCYFIWRGEPLFDLEAVKAKRRVEIRVRVVSEERSKMTHVAWVDKANGLAKVPLEASRTYTVEQLTTKKVSSSSIKKDPVLPPPLEGGGLPSAPSGVQSVVFPNFPTR